MNPPAMPGRPARLAPAFVLAGLISATAWAGELLPEIAPDPAYEPREVVGIQMRALANNDAPRANAGIEITFRFASPGNRAVTGPLERFATLFDQPDYRPMIDHLELEIGPETRSRSIAIVPVRITGRDARQAAYLFRLSRQDRAPYENCWMTDSVVRLDPPGDGPT